MYHAGPTVVSGRVQYNGTTVSASHIVWLCKIPANVTITDFYLQGVSPNDADIWKVGIVAETDIGTMTLSATAQRVVSKTTPLKISLSDSANPRYKTLYLTHNSGTATATGSLSWRIEYVPNAGAGGL
jgi:type 1 fimbria pilin